MTTPIFKFEYSLGKQPLLEDLKDIWCNRKDSNNKYFDVKMVPLKKNSSFTNCDKATSLYYGFLFICLLYINRFYCIYH